MDESKTRQKILKRIRKALIHKTPNRFPRLDFDSSVYTDSPEPPEVQFAQEFVKVNGHFVFCENREDFAVQFAQVAREHSWKSVFVTEPDVAQLLSQAPLPVSSEASRFLTSDTTVTSCEYLVARTGSIIVSSRLSSGRRGHVFPDNHVVLAYTSQLVPDIKDALSGLREKYGEQFPSFVGAITGPSRTADIEKTLVQGAHGAKEIYVFLVDDQA